MIGSNLSTNLAWVARPLSRPLMGSILLANVVTALLGMRYALLTVSMRLPGDLTLLVVLMGAYCMVATGVVGALCRRRLRVLRVAETAPRHAAPEQLAQAELEVQGLADYTFVVTLAAWLLSAVFANVVLWGMNGFSGPILELRTCIPALLFGPLASLLTYCMVTLRARGVTLGLLSLGLTAPLAIAVTPRRAQIRLRLILFTAIVVVTPAVFIWDVSSVLTHRAYEQVLAASSPERQ
ncbi:MAG: methyl-accepting chemotaxis protein, partial [Cystobacter sp.]